MGFLQGKPSHDCFRRVMNTAEHLLAGQITKHGHGAVQYSTWTGQESKLQYTRRHSSRPTSTVPHGMVRYTKQRGRLVMHLVKSHIEKIQCLACCTFSILPVSSDYSLLL